MTDRRTRIVIGCVVAALMMIPPIVAVVTMFGRHWYPVSDLAIFDMSVRDVWSAHPPLTGLWSRPGWSHPGPLAYWLVALFSRPLGSPAWATRVGAALIEGCAIASLAWITWRRGLRLMLAAATVTGMTYLGTGPWIFRQPWNLHIPLPFFLLFLFLTVVVAEGSTRLFIAMAFVGSLIVQTHIGYAVLVGTGFAWAIGWTIADAHRTRRAPDRWRSTVLLSVAVLLVVWLGPIVDTLVYWPGNLRSILGYFLAGSYSHVGFGRAAGIFASEFRFVPQMLGGPDRQPGFLGFAQPAALVWLVVPAVLLIAGVVTARVSRRRADLRRVMLAALLAAIAVIAISRADEPRAYTFQWRVVIAAYVVVATLWAVAGAMERRLPGAVRAVGVASLVGITAWGAIGPNISAASLTRGPPEAREATLRRIMHVVRRRDLATVRTILLTPLTNSEQLYGGLVNELDRAGVEVRVPDKLARIYGGHRVGDAGSADEVWYVTEKGSTLPGLLRMPGARLIASTSPLSKANNVELDRLQALVGAQLASGGHPRQRELIDSDLFPFVVAHLSGVDATAAARIGALNQLVARHAGCRCAVVAVPGGRAGVPR